MTDPKAAQDRLLEACFALGKLGQQIDNLHEADKEVPVNLAQAYHVQRLNVEDMAQAYFHDYANANMEDDWRGPK